MLQTLKDDLSYFFYIVNCHLCADSYISMVHGSELGQICVSNLPTKHFQLTVAPTTPMYETELNIFSATPLPIYFPGKSVLPPTPQLPKPETQELSLTSSPLPSMAN